jgi:hypothetical protein
MKQPIDPNLPLGNDVASLKTRLYEVFKTIAIQLNGISEGRMSAFHNAYTAAPTTGTWAQGDSIKNSAPAEAGIATAKYVIIGWVCTVGGTPGTWLECRCLTGN